MDPRPHKPQDDRYFHQHDGACHADPSQRAECKAQGLVTVRKVQKADRERMRRDKLNEQFQELGTTLDPDRPRNDKATILGDTIQMLKDLSSQVNKLKAEYSSLSEEERELTQEKNELRDEKASLKSDIDNLNTQYQQRIRMLYPWTGMEPSVVIGPPPSYPFPVPVPIPTGAVPMHPQLQAYPFFRNQTLGTVPNPCTPYMAYTQPCHPDQPSNQFSTPVPRSSSNQSHSPAQDHRSKSCTLQQTSCGRRSDDFGDVATDLELKTPGSSAPSHSEIAKKDSSSDLKKKKQCINQINGSILTEGSSSSRCSSSGPPDVSNSVGDGSVPDDQ
ncbi:transcription factor bHLH121 isoform X2 [Brachypodium distachyon]|uniref:BHLH domain-containing protein n=1 Tax=Brachypodium distachyon TaxID=15368 RepID=I1HZY6_BRADI|nr:transcription factor bHLH121 isoform X2 [Brachypodium distachyon]KQJ94621.1 hypothetical protein BRADI_3g11520v3 [Brachypodium distachyon]|eukprot:XP_003573201.1 transcription factor bHLH121 isoform X2 [Brachypodium distachyon]